jgi:hypothetical protein
MNASDATDSKNTVFVNHGWDSMRCLKKFDPNVTYRTYVRMQPWQNSIWAGDVYLFDGDDIVAVYGGVKVPDHALVSFCKFTNKTEYSSKLWRGRSWTPFFLLRVLLHRSQQQSPHHRPSMSRNRGRLRLRSLAPALRQLPSLPAQA